KRSVGGEQHDEFLPDLVDVPADEVVDLVHDRASADGQGNVATRANEATRLRCLIDHLAFETRIAEVSLLDSDAEFASLERLDRVREVEVPYVGDNQGLGTLKRDHERCYPDKHSKGEDPNERPDEDFIVSLFWI